MRLAPLLWSFNGRISRGEFWLGILLSSLAFIGADTGIRLLFVNASGETNASLIAGFVSLILIVVVCALCIAVFAVHAKRFHDRGRSGWWSLILLVPFGPIWTLIECGCLEGMREPNAFGLAPKGLTRKQRRLSLIAAGLAVCCFAAFLTFIALGINGSLAFFRTPTEIAEKKFSPGTRIRVGGLVKDGSLVHVGNLSVRFEVTDGNSEIPVSYQGVLPDLFREGQGVVAEGTLDGSGVFDADTILAKHDETYMPKEVADALKKSGHWKDDYAQRAALPVVGAGK
jgi:cytochrome c-type biogenesis protein CcmE